jgi:N-acetylmuramoyl-L-alanine amidase
MALLLRRVVLFIALISFLLHGLIIPSIRAEAAPEEQIICLDAGHQRYGNNELEPAAPGSKEMKAKVSSGTRGVKTKKPEYVLNLEAARMIKEKLEAYGYKVVMTRETHDVDISNKERAALCNQAGADLAVRIHADGNDSPKANGISLLYPARSGHSEMIYSKSMEAAQKVLKEAVNVTGAASRGAMPRSDLSGFNWSEVPAILLEMGFMTNPEEEEKLSDPDYLDRLAQGVVNGINDYFTVQPAGAEMEAESSLYLPANSRLFERLDGKMIRTTASLSSQTVQVSAVWDDWYKVNTWLGERWIHIQE